MATKIIRVFQEFTIDGYVPFSATANLDFGVTVANTFPGTTPSTYQTDDPDIEVDVTTMTDFYVWIRGNGQDWNINYTRNVRVYPDSPDINNVVMGVIIANLPGIVPYEGATQDVDIRPYGLFTQFVQFSDTTPVFDYPTDSGTIYYDVNDETLNLIGLGGTVQQIGQEIYYPKCSNQTGTTILNGTLVMVNPSQIVQGEKLSIQPAITDGTYSADLILGLATQDIVNNGMVTWFGYVRDIDTANINLGGETWAVGNILYGDPANAGGLTNVEPIAPNHKSKIAVITKLDAGGIATLMVRPTLGQHLYELHDVNIDTIADNQGLIWDATNERWENRDIVVSPYSIPVANNGYYEDSNITTDGSSVEITGDLNITGGNLTNDGDYYLLDAGAGINYIPIIQGLGQLINSPFYVDGNDVGFNTTNPSNITGWNTIALNGTNGGLLEWKSGDVNKFHMYNNADKWIIESVLDSNDAIQMLYSNGYVGIGYGLSSTPAYRLDVNGDINIASGSLYRVNGSQISTSNVLEGTNLYYTDARARASLSGTSPITYNSTTGAIGITQATTSTNGYLSSADWNTFNNKQDALTNPVTGSLTSGYIPKATGTTTLGNSLIYDNGTGIGIGTTTPSKILEVAKASADNQIVLTESSDSGNLTALFYARRSRGTSLTSPTAIQSGNNMGGMAIGAYNGTDYQIGSKIIAKADQNWTTSAQGTYLAFYTTSNNTSTLEERMRITSSGLVGIGTTTPSALLHLNVASNGEYFRGGAGNLRQLQLISYDTISAYAGHQFNASSGNGELQFAIGGSAKMTIQSDGDVQITGAFEVLKLTSGYTSGGNYINFSNASGLLMTLGYSQNNSDNFSIRNYKNSSTYFYNNNSIYMTATSAGLVGIGTTAPARILHLLTSGASAIQLETSGTTTDSFIDFLTPSYNFRVGYDYSASVFKIANTNFNSNSFCIDQSGNVGIGASSPSAQLHINNDTSNSYATLRLEGANRGGIIDMYNQASYPVSRILTDQSGNIFISTSGAFASTSLSEKFTILTGGNVGIGTTAPSTLLDVRGEVSIAYNATYGLRFYNDARSNWSSIGNNTTGNAGANLVFKTGGGTAMTITNETRVGIGATSPSYKLEVFTDSVLDGILIRGGNAPALRLRDTTDAGDSLIYTNNGGRLVLSADDSNATASSSLEFKVDGTERMRITSGGRVLIATSSQDSATASMELYNATNAQIIFKNTSKRYIYGLAGSDSNSFNIYDLTTDQLYFSARSGGQIRFGMYGSGGKSGTVAYYLAVDSSGNIIETTVSTGGGISGSGSANRIPKFTGSTSIGNSAFYEGGTGVDGFVDGTFTSSGDLFSVSGGIKIGGVTTKVVINNSNQTNSTGDLNLGVYSYNTMVKLKYNNQIEFGGSGSSGTWPMYVAYSTWFNSNVHVDGTFTYVSDMRLKSNINELDKGLNDIIALNPKSYNKKGNFEYGLIAQEVESILPQIVGDNGKNKTLKYFELIPIMVNAIKELKQELDELKK